MSRLLGIINLFGLPLLNGRQLRPVGRDNHPVAREQQDHQPVVKPGRNDNPVLPCSASRVDSLSSHLSEPYISYNGRWGAAMDGHIENHASIRKQLLKLGFQFQSNSIAELILKSWQAWGESTALKLEGSFAFAIIDSVKNRWWLVRDPIGTKPLYYTRQGDGVLFASTLAQIKLNSHFQLKPNLLAIRHYLTTLRLHFDNQTLYQDICSVRPGEIVTGYPQGVRFQEYGDRYRTEEFSNGDYDLAVEEFEDHLRMAIKLFQQVDRVTQPSHGIAVLDDGSIQTQLLFRMASETAIRGRTPIRCGWSCDVDHLDFTEKWRSLVADQRLPLCSPLDVLYRVQLDQIRNKAKTLLVAEGAAELFCGLGVPSWAGADFDRAAKLVNMAGQLGTDVRASLIRQYGRDRFYSESDHFLLANGFIPRNSLLSLFRPEVWGQADSDRTLEKYYDHQLQHSQGQSMAEREANLLGKLTLENRLLRFDRITDENGINVRTPFVDSRVVTHASRIPYHFKIDINPHESQPWLSSADLHQRGSLRPMRILKSVAQRWLTKDDGGLSNSKLVLQTIDHYQQDCQPHVQQQLLSSPFLKQLFRKQALQDLATLGSSNAIWGWPIANLAFWGDQEFG